LTKGPQWMPLNVGDYLRDTSHLTVSEHGAYMLLIMRYWQDGGLPAEESLVRRYSLLTAEQWIESRPVLAALFDEGWKHKRIDAELAKAADIIDKRRSAAEQRHGKSNAHAEHPERKSSYAGVPPSPSPLPNNPPSSVPEAERARDLFGELWEAFPQNPSSSETKARKAFERIKASEQPDVIAAAERFARWFAQDCEARERTVDAGLHYVPHLGKWLDSDEWRDATKLPIKGEADPAFTAIHRDSDDFQALVRHRGGKPIPVYSESGMYSVPVAELEQARASVH
jgi:uncharacterized protein YdaU (DUF1376 family)